MLFISSCTLGFWNLKFDQNSDQNETKTLQIIWAGIGCVFRISYYDDLVRQKKRHRHNTENVLTADLVKSLTRTNWKGSYSELVKWRAANSTFPASQPGNFLQPFHWGAVLSIKSQSEWKLHVLPVIRFKSTSVYSAASRCLWSAVLNCTCSYHH